MAEKEAKAIKYLNEFIEELQCDINMFGFEDDCEEEQNLLVEQRDNFKTILNMLEQKDKRNIEPILINNKMYFIDNEIYNELLEDIKSNYISVQKVKDKIEKLNALNEGWKIELENKNKEIKELKEKYDKDTHTLQNQLDITNADKINNYICKSEIKCKIEELDIEISECEYSDDDDEKYKKADEKDKLCLLNQKRALKQLLESEE